MLPAFIGAGSGLETHFIPALERQALASPRKLLIVLHGKGDELSSFYDLPHELPLPQTDYLLLNAPYPMKEGRKWMLWDEPRHRPTLELTRSKLQMLVAELEAWGYPTEQILWLGHSQGGRVALDLVLNSTLRFAGLIGVSSYMGWMLAERQGLSTLDLLRSSVACARSTPMLFTHGRRDRVITPREIRGDIQQARALGFDVTYAEFEKGHEFEDPREMRFIQAWVQARRWRSFPMSGMHDVRSGSASRSKAPASHAKVRIVADLHRPTQADP